MTTLYTTLVYGVGLLVRYEKRGGRAPRYWEARTPELERHPPFAVIEETR
jgi:hypothetical protein